MCRLLVSLGFGALLAFFSSASAATFTCDAETTGEVTPADQVVGCEYSDTLTNTNDLAAINAEMFFGLSDWSGFSTDIGAGATGSVFSKFGVTKTGTGSSGTLTFDVDLASGYQIMILFKGGNKVLPGTVTGYLLDSLASAFTYNTPFFKDGGKGQDQDISHLRIVYREVGDPVPLPGAAWLMLAGIGGLVGMRRRA